MTTTAVRFTVSGTDARLIDRIVARATGADLLASDALNLSMDLCAVHANGCPLRLAALLVADRFNFAHDIVGIQRHIDRRTGRLGDHFLPRFAAPQPANTNADTPKSAGAAGGVDAPPETVDVRGGKAT